MLSFDAELDRLAELEALLAPVDSEADELGRELWFSHLPDPDFSASARAFRRPIFDRLTDLCERYGRLRIERASLRRALKSAMQQEPRP